MMAQNERDDFEAKAAAVLGDPNYEAGLKREAELMEQQRRREHAAGLRRLAVVAVAALKGDHGQQAQAFTQDALTKHGDVRGEVAALAAWDEVHRRGEPLTEIERLVVRKALESWAVEHSLRALEALAREAAQGRKKATTQRKAGQHG
jgi:hypothetical protein